MQCCNDVMLYYDLMRRCDTRMQQCYAAMCNSATKQSDNKPELQCGNATMQLQPTVTQTMQCMML
eukprot:1985959-Rhodomonas_salina.1